MLGKIHRDAVEVEDDAFFAAYVSYVGHDVLKCTAGSSRTAWMFLIPECDFLIMREEYENADTSLFLRAYVSAVKKIWNFQKLARQSSGEFLTNEWKDLIRRRADEC